MEGLGESFHSDHDSVGGAHFDLAVGYRLLHVWRALLCMW